ncbi:hypothetical protein F2Q70_00013005 [Brassica cretica]|uniref:Uncharacterized protein n=1 Tax=Brassica cretica TaxID=69181 RepID=A0A8S9MCK0_BRACR|nr:hypothetical protein F2Q70_00013005 [Brassica cretica]KAF3550299.1 hypothetical protein DY000_02009403 [Brassica cretica]
MEDDEHQAPQLPFPERIFAGREERVGLSAAASPVNLVDSAFQVKPSVSASLVNLSAVVSPTKLSRLKSWKLK